MRASWPSEFRHIWSRSKPGCGKRKKTRAETEKARADITLADMQISRGLQAGQAGDAAVAALWFANAALSTPRRP
jgi:hypothetical protein